MGEGEQKEGLKKAIGTASGKAKWFEDFAKTEATAATASIAVAETNLKDIIK